MDRKEFAKLMGELVAQQAALAAQAGLLAQQASVLSDRAYSSIDILERENGRLLDEVHHLRDILQKGDEWDE